ncbi:MAG: ROK family protein [Candidatus Eisenbacteria bacterium]|nr:ROK family protein [Candidatus Eisenbacteria bacterium]
MTASFKSAVALGVDIGGTFVKTALVGPGPAVLERARLTMDPGEPAEALLRRLSGTLYGLEALVEGRPALPVGVGCAGLIDARTGVVRTSPNLPLWRDVPLVAALSEGLAVHRAGPPETRTATEAGRTARVVLDNDANVFSFAEGFFGAARDAANAVFVTLGTGVGGGLKLDGRLYTGSCGFAGEIGHITIDPDGPVCACGNRGCLESFVGSGSIVRRARKMIEDEGRQNEWLSSGLSSLDELTAEDVGRAAQAGDALATRVFGEAGEHLGVALAGVVNLLNPEVVVLGGGVSKAGEPLFSAVRSTVLRRALGLSSRCVRIVPALLGEDAGVIGAAMKAAGSGGS